jgi:hypothetical protein
LLFVNFKKRLYLILFLISCSNNDVTEPIEVTDPIIGKWFYYSYRNDNEIHYADNCNQKAYFEFLEDVNSSYVSYKTNNSSDCIKDDTMNVRWSLIDMEYSIQTFYGDGISASFPPRQVSVTYQYYGTISDSILTIPVGAVQYLYFIKR